MLPIIPAAIIIPYFKREHLHLWMQKRIEPGPFQGLYEFPGGKLNDGESATEAAYREFIEEVGVDIHAEELTFFAEYMVVLEKKKINLNVFLLECSEELQASLEGHGAFYQVRDLEGLEVEIPSSNHQIIADLVKFHSV
jgi:8-oxo-dGTP diphosphatase